MNKATTHLLFACACLLGAAAIVWTGYEFAGTNTLALGVTACIGGVYLIGIVELLRFRRATAGLGNALGSITAQTMEASDWFEHWLKQLDASLYASVRLRIVGERIGLPTPAFTPYLVGLLVMLGMLGTFVGMVATLSGTVSALQGSAELDAIRNSLTAPIQGLGVAFGTSVAGVAASAMLGLISTLVRHDRIAVTRQLDMKITTVFREFSLAHQRQAAFDAVQSQAATLPAVANNLQAVATQLTRMGEQLGEALLANQTQFHTATEKRYSELALSVDKSLRETLAASGQAAGMSMQPVLTDAVAEINRMLQDTQQQQAQSAREQLRALGDEFGAAGNTLLDAFAATSTSWTGQTLALQHDIKQTLTDSVTELADTARTSSASMLTEIGGLLHSTEALVQARTATEATWLDTQSARMEQLTAALTEHLSALRAQEEQGQAAALARLAMLETTVTAHLTQLGAGLEAPMTRLIETASETPRAAAEVIGLLRAEISNTVERDNQLLEERVRVMQELNALSARMSEASAHVAGGAIELNSLGEAFGLAVNLFNTSNAAMMEHLTRVEESMDRSSTRSDEQMAYYVAQAREIIDHSMLSQKEIIDDMRQLKRQSRQLAAGAQ